MSFQTPYVASPHAVKAVRFVHYTSHKDHTAIKTPRHQPQLDIEHISVTGYSPPNSIPIPLQMGSSFLHPNSISDIFKTPLLLYQIF